jgi:hypothetical protein
VESWGFPVGPAVGIHSADAGDMTRCARPWMTKWVTAPGATSTDVQLSPIHRPYDYYDRI